MRCAKCGTDNREGRRFCAECGAPMAVKCARCGGSNQPGEKFCGECGTALSGRPLTPKPEPVQTVRFAGEDGTLPPEGERKNVTALFADIKGSMELMEDLDPEEARSIIDPALRIEQRKDAIARGLHYVAFVVMYRVDHAAQGWVYDRTRLFGIEVLHQLHRALDVGE